MYYHYIPVIVPFTIINFRMINNNLAAWITHGLVCLTVLCVNSMTIGLCRSLRSLGSTSRDKTLVPSLISVFFLIFLQNKFLNQVKDCFSNKKTHIFWASIPFFTILGGYYQSFGSKIDEGHLLGEGHLLEEIPYFPLPPTMFWGTNLRKAWAWGKCSHILEVSGRNQKFLCQIYVKCVSNLC